MLTISILFDALSSPDKMRMSQNKLAEAFNTSASTINAWIKKERQPRWDASVLCDGIEECRRNYAVYNDDAFFIESLINNLDIGTNEKTRLKNEYGEFQRKSPRSSCRSFLLHLIQLSLNKTTLDISLPYAVNDAARPVAGIGGEHVLVALRDGRVLSSGRNDFQQCCTGPWRDVVSVAAGWRSSLGLKKDGTCIAVGRGVVGNGEIFRWKDLTAVACGAFHYLGLRSDGTVCSYGLSGDGQCQVSDWRNITAVAAGTKHSVGLREDGTVVARGYNGEGQCEVSGWSGVVRIAAAGDHTIGLTKDGEILLAGYNHTFNFTGWSDVVSVATGIYHVTAVREDGSVLHTGSRVGGLDQVYRWFDLAAVYAGFNTTVGIQTNGNVLVTNDPARSSYIDCSDWNLYGERKPAGDSPYEAMKAEILSELGIIRENGLALTPFLHEEASAAGGEDLMRAIEEKSRMLWDLYQRIRLVEPLSDQLLRYCAAFADFRSLVRAEGAPDTLRRSEEAYDACIDFLTVIAMIMKELRMMP